MRSILAGLAAALLLFGLSGCDDASEQDEGDAPASFEGRVLDGPVATGEVYLDRSETDYLLQSSPTARSATSDGRFKLEGVAISGMNRVVLRVHKGRDKWHGLQVPVTMSRHVEQAQPGDDLNNIHITPLTSLMSHLDEDEKRSFVGYLSERDDGVDIYKRHANGDYLDLDDDDYTDDARLVLLRFGFRLQKMAEVIAAELHSHYSELDEQEGRFVYPALAEASQSGGPSDDIGEFIEDVVVSADEAVANHVGEGPRGDSWGGGGVDKNQYITNLEYLWDLIGSETGVDASGTGLFAHGAISDEDLVVTDEQHIAARARALETAARVLRDDPDDGDFKNIAKNLANYDDNSGTGHDEYNKGDAGAFGPQLDVAGYAEDLSNNGWVAASSHNRGESLRGRIDGSGLSDVEFDGNSSSSGQLSLEKADDGSYEASVSHEELGGEEVTASFEFVDDYTGSIEFDSSTVSEPGILRKTGENGGTESYEFELLDETYEFDLDTSSTD